MNTPNLDNISRKSKIRVTDIINIIEIIKTQTPTVSELTRITNLSHGQMKRLVLLLNPKFVNYNTASPRLTLTNMGGTLLSEKSEKEPPFNLQGIQDFIRHIKSLMPVPKREYDQFYATEETVINRVKKLNGQKDLQDRKIVFLGDDDLTSLAVAYTFRACDISVLEIDTNILNVIEKVCKEHRLKINYVLWDLKKAIPKEFLHKSDTVFTDSPYTENGFDLFLRRSLEATKENGLSSHYICYGTSPLSREKSLKVQQIINQYGLFIREKTQNFNKYIKGAETVGNTSDLYILEKTPQTKLGKSKPLSKLYTWE
ncbi:MAG: bis-aminopropyl spermidine synthase family protein [Patescibacteria group bacterium]|nr:bis-aminopropyl spermidine synthase family protein [Patescibacteria group bacterium]